MCTATEIFEGQRVEPPHHLYLKLEPQRTHDLMAERAAGGVGHRVFRALEPAQGTDDIAEADPPSLPGEPIAPAGAADAEKDLVPDQFLKHRLEIAARNALALGNLRRANRRVAAIVSNVEHRLD